MGVANFTRKNKKVIWKSDDERLSAFYNFLKNHGELDGSDVFEELVEIYEEIDNDLIAEEEE